MPDSFRIVQLATRRTDHSHRSVCTSRSRARLTGLKAATVSIFWTRMATVQSQDVGLGRRAASFDELVLLAGDRTVVMLGELVVILVIALIVF